MGGRNAQPINLLLAKGKSHKTKAEINQRQSSEIRFGSNVLECPEYILNDSVACDKWNEMIDLYTDVEFISSADIGLLGRYCKTFSEYNELISAQQRIKEIHYDCEELDAYINDTYQDDESDEDKQIFGAKVKKQLRDLFSIQGILAIESAINKKMDMLIKMEDRLFLNPLAKVKNVPKKEKENEVESKYARFSG